MQERMKQRMARFNKLQPMHIAEAAVVGLLIILVFGQLKSSGPAADQPAGAIAGAATDSSAGAAAPQITAPAAFPHIAIKNFGQMDSKFYRGAQPNPDDYAVLAGLGIKTIIDL